MVHVLAIPSTLRFNKFFFWCLKMCWHQLKDFYKRQKILHPESSCQTNRITANLLENDVFLLSWGPFKEKKTVEIKFITSAPPYRLNNIESRIKGFCGFNFGCFRTSLGGNLAPIWKQLCLEMEYKNAYLICGKLESYLFSLQI